VSASTVSFDTIPTLPPNTAHATVDGSTSDTAGLSASVKRRKLIAIESNQRNAVLQQYVERVVDLIEPEANQIYNLTVEQAQRLLLEQPAEAVGGIEGSFALIARAGKTVKMARSLDRPMRYFLAKKQDGPVLVVASRIDAIYHSLKNEGLERQFHPSYSRMVPAHYVVEIQLVGCPDPDPTYTRFFAPELGTLPPDLDRIGERYIAALAEEISQWLSRVPANEPLGVCFSGGIDSGSVFLATYHVMRKRGMNLGRLKAFVLDVGNGPDVQQARAFLDALDLGLFLETVETDASALDPQDTIRIVEDYKPLDIESATMALALCRGIRARYPGWHYLLDGDGGDENLKDYPIEENPELTIGSVIHNRMLYQEGWGVGKIKHSLTYSGGLSRSYTRTYAPAHHFGFTGLSPYTRPKIVAIAEAIPFIQLTDYRVDRLYELKGEIVSRGIEKLTGMKMPVFPKRRFQHGALPEDAMRRKLPFHEAEYRRQFFALYQ
jgi:asparagine synthase (glutamine-hydrolysing)